MVLQLLREWVFYTSLFDHSALFLDIENLEILLAGILANFINFDFLTKRFRFCGKR